MIVTFNSDPNGATVAEADGTVLGVTPLLIEVPYGGTAIEYVIRKEGYVAKVASIVPNVPSPFFAVLEARAASALLPVVAARPAVGQLNADARPPTETSPKVGLKHGHSKTAASEGEPKEDDDGVMDPSAP